ncbi:MAG: molybdopterin-dependent oxidoreductase [Deltaproteobacteria bacterium]|jgi:aldehyde oxidoreductase|nr:molybdopterin-dependent oxidoreductase [Deltaproteobacteria bacterium]
MIQKNIYVNGIAHNIFVDQETTLAKVLREQLHLLGTKIGCGEGMCGACNVIVDGKLTRSCVIKMKRIPEDAKILTIEGIGSPLNLHPIQKAWVKHGGAQCGFCSPGFIVSTKALLDSNPDPSRDEIRDWFQKNRNACRCTGYIPLVNAVVEAARVLRGHANVESLDYKLPADGHIFGSDSRYPRPTAIGKVTGTLKYGGDLALELPPNRLYLALVQAEVSHANIKSIDTSEAEKMPGVFKIITHKDVKGNNRINGLAFPTNKGDGKERPILCDSKVFQYGDAIAVVAAYTEEQAKAAVKAVKVDLEVLPAYLSIPAAKAPDAIEIHPGTPNTYFIQPHNKGEDTKPIFADPNVVTSESFMISSRQPHMPIEPDCAFGFINDDGAIIIHSKSIGVHLHKVMIQEGLALGDDQLQLVCNPMGGTFGYKFSPTIEALVAVSVQATGRPCYLLFNYHQQQQYTGKRSPFYGTVRFATDKKGKILGMETDYDVDHGPYCEFGDLLTLRGIQFMGAAYDVPNIRGEGRTVCTNHAFGSAFRGYGGTQAQLFSEVAADVMAAELKMDPWEFRYLNCHKKGGKSTNPSGQDLDSRTYDEMLLAIKPAYEEALARAKAQSTPTHKKGVGLAAGSYGCGLDGPDSSNARAELNPDGTITIRTAWQDHGQGADMGAVGTAHQALRPMGVSPELLKFTWADTRNPVSGPSGGSRSQVMTGGAVRVACENFLAGLKKPDGSGYYTYDEAKKAGVPTDYDGTFSVPGVPLDANGLGSPFMVYMYGVCLAEITVELATGKVKVDKVIFNVDIGKVNNRLVTDGQLWGGVAQAIGLALTEDFDDIQKHKTMVGAGFPFIKDIPDDITINYFESPREYGPFGAAGTGEIPLCVPHPAILNAIYNATGARVTRIPALPERVLEAIKNKDKKKK